MTVLSGLLGKIKTKSRLFRQNGSSSPPQTTSPNKTSSPRHQSRKTGAKKEKVDLGVTVEEVVRGREGMTFIANLTGGTTDSAKVSVNGVVKVVKLRRSPAQCDAEVAATELYGKLGAYVPTTTSESYTTPSGTTLGVLIQDFIEGPTLLELLQSNQKGQHDTLVESAFETLSDTFLLDALFANWDVIGGRGGDNIVVHTTESGEVRGYRVDNAGVFGFRAQGGRKEEAAWGMDGFVSELHTMRSLGETGCAQVFSRVSDEALVVQYIDLYMRLTPALQRLASSSEKVSDGGSDGGRSASRSGSGGSLRGGGADDASEEEPLVRSRTPSEVDADSLLQSAAKVGAKDRGVLLCRLEYLQSVMAG